MDGSKKQQLIEALTKRLEDSANSTNDEFGLKGRDFDQIAKNIVEDFEKYVEYRNSDKWKDEEGYKWELIKNRFDNSSMKPIPDYLPDYFFDKKSNLCGDFRLDNFNNKNDWEKTNLTEFDGIKEGEEITKAKKFIRDSIKDKPKIQSAALLLFFLFPAKFFAYNNKSLIKTAKEWGIEKPSLLVGQGESCYKSWINFTNQILIPAFHDNNAFEDLKKSTMFLLASRLISKTSSFVSTRKIQAVLPQI